jgi:hypothetical protein
MGTFEAAARVGSQKGVGTLRRTAGNERRQDERERHIGERASKKSTSAAHEGDRSTASVTFVPWRPRRPTTRLDRGSVQRRYGIGRARSSAGEHTLHTGGVTGSIPVAPTRLFACFQYLRRTPTTHTDAFRPEQTRFRHRVTGILVASASAAVPGSSQSPLTGPLLNYAAKDDPRNVLPTDPRFSKQLASWFYLGSWEALGLDASEPAPTGRSEVDLPEFLSRHNEDDGPTTSVKGLPN